MSIWAGCDCTTIRPLSATRAPSATKVRAAGHLLRRGCVSLGSRKMASNISTSGCSELDTLEPNVLGTEGKESTQSDTAGSQARRDGHPHLRSTVHGDLRTGWTDPDCDLMTCGQTESPPGELTGDAVGVGGDHANTRSFDNDAQPRPALRAHQQCRGGTGRGETVNPRSKYCLLYTSDA